MAQYDENNNPVSTGNKAKKSTLTVDRQTVKNIFDLFDTDKTGQLNANQAKKCYELVCGKSIDQKYLIELIYENLLKKPIVIENLQYMLNHYHTIMKFLSAAHVEHEILSHNSDCMNFKTSRAFVELSVKRPLNDN